MMSLYFAILSKTHNTARFSTEAWPTLNSGARTLAGGEIIRQVCENPLALPSRLGIQSSAASARRGTTLASSATDDRNIAGAGVAELVDARDLKSV